MPEKRGTSRASGTANRPGGRSGPGRTSTPRRPRTAEVPVVEGEVLAQRPASRVTGRAVVLILVVAVLTVSYASSMRAYLQQRAEIGELKDTISERADNIDALEREKRRWNDPAYVRTQARERFGYLMPGETAFVVLDENGLPIQPQAELSDPETVGDQTPEAFWGSAWESVKLAGNPPRVTKPPLSKIDGSTSPSGQ